MTWAKQIFYSATSSIFHVDYSINSCWSRTLCAIKSEIPSPATVIAFIEPELTTPVHTQTCVVRRLLENAFLLKGKSNQPNSRLPSFNPFTHRENALTNYRVYDILSYDDSNYSGGIQGTPPHLFLDQTEAKSGSDTELYLFNNAFVWYSGTRWVKQTL